MGTITHTNGQVHSSIYTQFVHRFQTKSTTNPQYELANYDNKGFLTTKPGLVLGGGVDRLMDPNKFGLGVLYDHKIAILVNGVLLL